MLNTPQISFANTNTNLQTSNSQISLEAHQNWNGTLDQFQNEQKVNLIHTDNTQTVSADLGNMVSRGDTLDRIPVFVNPHDLNQTGQTPQTNQATQPSAGGNNAFHNHTSSNFNEYNNHQEQISSSLVHSGSDSQQPQSDHSTIQEVLLHSPIY